MVGIDNRIEDDMVNTVWTTSKSRDEVAGTAEGDAYPALRWHNVKLDDGRTIQLFVNLDTNLVVLDIQNAPNRHGNTNGGVELYRYNVSADLNPSGKYTLSSHLTKK